MELFASKSAAIEPRELEHEAISRKLAAECIVLLENNGVLPLKGEKKVALFGAGARHTVRGGTGSGEVNVRRIVNVQQGFENAGYEVVSAAWLDKEDGLLKEHKDAYLEMIGEEARKLGVPQMIIAFDKPYIQRCDARITLADMAAAPAETAVYVISRNSGEGKDRHNDQGDYRLFEDEIENLKKIAEHYKNSIVVLNIGGVMDVTAIKAIPGLDALVLMSQLGNLGGDALLDVLTGAVTPSGKTTDTWAKDYADYPSSAKFSHHSSIHDEEYEDGIFVGYRYFDSFEVEPVYPFGYGLSYTKFVVHPGQMSLRGRDITVTAKVSNTGAYDGKEVVQVYVTSPDGYLVTPYQELAAYAKTDLIKAGTSQMVEIKFPIDRLVSYDTKNAAWILMRGDYVVRVGNSSANTQVVGIITVPERMILEKTENQFALDIELTEIQPNLDRLKAKKEEYGKRTDLSRIVLEPEHFGTITVAYSGPREEYTTDKTQVLTADDIRSHKCTVEELVAQLTVEEMATLCVGTLRTENGSVVGNASYVIPGAAGDSSPVLLESRGIINMITADGPAGVRLQPHFKTDLEGNILPGGGGMGDSFEPFDPKYDETNSIDYYQYCTAIPIGWAIAQSWNAPLIEETGLMIGKELEQFGIQIWLAPALNIHRNPLCGRNFEYYSEDPLVAGTVAAALSRGVQKQEGKAVCIKHFAANNQEDNRFFCNAHVSERALREIYLKGFEIAIKEGLPISMMSSYNLINGTHTPNRYDLLQSVARDEWGFDGMIMTDWYTSQHQPNLSGVDFVPKYPISSSVGCIKAGNDLQMPGCQQNVQDIIDAVTTGKEIDGYTITLADLQFCAANMVRAAIRVK